MVDLLQEPELSESRALEVLPSFGAGPEDAGAGLEPMTLYLASLAAGPGREGMLSALRRIAFAFDCGDPADLPWHRLSYPQMVGLRARLAETYAPATANKLLSALRGVLRECWRLKRLSTDDYHRLLDVPGVSGDRLPAGRALNDRELQDLFLACADGSAMAARDAALFALLFSCGLRRAEACQLDLSGVDPVQWRVVLVGKGNRERSVPVRGGGREALEQWLKVRGGMAGPFICHVARGGVVISDVGLTPQAVRKRLLVRSKQARLASCSPHDLRRSFVTRLLESGVDLNVARSLAGHRQVQTTARYDRRDDRAAERAAAGLETPFVASPSRG